MLEPTSRALFLDALRPPVGYQLDFAVGTTFTTDLLTALTVPLAFAGYSLSGVPDPLALMDALERTSRRIAVFGQAGAISPRWPGELAALLEPMLHTVRRPKPGHLFHPKVWVARYVDDEGQQEIRCVVCSRNLTGDRSWDVMLRLDQRDDVATVNRGNDGLMALLRALPAMSQTSLDAETVESIEDLVLDLRRVHWASPVDKDVDIRFLAFGVEGGVKPAQARDVFRGFQHTLIAPFMTPEGVGVLTGGNVATRCRLVSRVGSLNSLYESEFADAECLVMNPAAEFSDDDGQQTLARLNGLHAKVYAILDGKRGYLYVGSANATGAAFGGNVELLCELAGGPKALGIDTLLDDSDDSSFRRLLESYEPEPLTDDEERDLQLDRALESVLIDLACEEFQMTAWMDGALWSAALTGPRFEPRQGPVSVAASIRPVNQSIDERPLVAGEVVSVQLAPRPAHELSPFFVVTVRASLHGRSGERAAVMKARWDNPPDGRLADLMLRQLDTPEKFLRFLMLMLSLSHDATGTDAASLPGSGGAWSTTASAPFELIVRALATAPEAVDRLGEMVERLQQSAHAQLILPAGFEELWATVAAARLSAGKPVRRKVDGRG